MSGAPYTVDAATKKLAWDSTLRMESGLDDIFGGFNGVTTEQGMEIPNAMKVTYKPETGAAETTLTMLRPLGGTGVTGETQQVGNEDNQTTVSMKIYANRISNAVPTKQYGPDYFNQNYLKIYDKAATQLGRWHKENDGKQIRQALCEVYSGNLLDSPTSLTAGINSNWIMPDSDGSTVVPYDSTLADYKTAIETAWGTPNSTNRLSVKVLNDLEDIAYATMELEALEIGGGNTIILTVPSTQRAFLRDPGSDSYFELLKDADTRGNNNRAITGILGKYGNLLLAVDMRAPTVTINSGVTFGYKGAGNTDNRAANGANVGNIGMLLAKGALFEYVQEELRMPTETQDYERIKGIAATKTTGWSLAQYDNLVSPTDTSIVNKSSAIVPFYSL